MKTLKQVQKEIDFLVKDSQSMGDKERKKAQKEVSILYQCRRYLETNPNEEFVKSMRDSIEKQIDSINENYYKWSQNNVPKTKNPKSEWRTINNYTLLKKELRVLNYLLE